MAGDVESAAGENADFKADKKQGNTQIVLIFLFSLLLRWCITYHPYSGQGKPPMFGDYEAQRHWQEITLNLPVEQWYINSTDNDILYWGLDYPPLTAYHSLILGQIAHRINSSYVELHKSRGFSSDDHKYFMRLTVLCADALIYIPAMIYFVSNIPLRNSQAQDCNVLGFGKRDIILSTSLIYPGLMLIDHGHFQYNCISLGLFVGSVTAVLKGSFILGSILFMAALNYKQMELYHALPIFFYILGTHLSQKKKPWTSSLIMLSCISLTVVATFILIWLPFLKNWTVFLNVVFRLFPIARGVFEDKVANIWCATNVIYKLRDTFANEQLAQICLAATTLAVLPSCINLYLKPSRERFIISLINSALSFFLFSFQVHEKSILLVAIPVLLHFHSDPLPCFWFLIISHFSMLPLLIKDGLYLAYVATLALYFLFVISMWPDLLDLNKFAGNEIHKLSNDTSHQKSKSKRKNKSSTTTKTDKNSSQKYNIFSLKSLKLHYNFWIVYLFYISIAGVILLSVISYFLKSPQRYPDLYPLLVSVYSCGHFIIFYMYFNYKQIFVSKQTMNKPKKH